MKLGFFSPCGRRGVSCRISEHMLTGQKIFYSSGHWFSSRAVFLDRWIVNPEQKQGNSHGVFSRKWLCLGLGGVVGMLANGSSQIFAGQQELLPSARDLRWDRLAEKQMQSGKRVLNLSQCREVDFASLGDWLSKHRHGFMRVEWGKSPPSDAERDVIEAQLRRNADAFQERPPPGVCAELCKLAYSDSLSLKSYHLGEWQVEMVRDEVGARDKDAATGYFGVALVNQKTLQIVLSHRGTNFTNGHHLATDLLGVLAGIDTKQLEASLCFTREVLDYAEKRGYRLGIVGHSLGGWLAQLTAYDCIARGYEDVYVVTLDTPGSEHGLKRQFASNGSFRLHVPLKNVDFTHYLSYPNIVNTCHPHVGEVIHIQPIFGQRRLWQHVVTEVVSWWSWWNGPPHYLKRLLEETIYSANTHASDPLVDAFDHERKFPNKAYEMKRWPLMERMGNTYDKIFDLVRRSASLSEQDNFLLKDHMGYDPVQPVRENLMQLRHFPPRTVEWLKWFEKERKEYPDRVDRCMTSARVSQEMRDKLLAFQLDTDANILSLPKTSNAWDFRKELVKTLKMYPELELMYPKNLTLEEVQSVISGSKREFVKFCDEVVQGRLGSQNRQGFVEREQDNRAKENKIASLIKERGILEQKLKGASLSQYWENSLKTEKVRWEIAGRIHAMYASFYSNHLQEASKAAEEILACIEEAERSSEQIGGLSEIYRAGLQLGRAKMTTCSCIAKLHRKYWQTDDDIERAENFYKQALEAEEEMGARCMLKSNYGALLNDWGDLYLRKDKNYKEAVKIQKRALELHEEAYQSSPTLAIRRDWGRGVFLYAQAKYKQACNAMQIQSLNASDSELRNSLKQEYLEQLERATRILNTDELAQPDITHYLFEGIVWQERYEVSKETKDLNKAKALYDRGLEKDSTHGSLHKRCAEVLFAAGEYSEAQKHIEQALKGFNTIEKTAQIKWLIEEAKTLKGELYRPT